MRCLLTLLLLTLLGSPILRAESRFAAPHLGLPVSSSDARSRGMGGVSTAIRGEDFSFTNPARTVNFWRSGFSGGMAQDYTSLDDGTSRYDLRTNNFLGLRAIFPSYFKFVVGWGIYQWRDLNWEYTDTVSVPFIENRMARHVQSEGGLYISRFSIARSLGDHVALGLGIDWMFGKAERTRSLFFQDKAYVDSRDAFNDKYSYLRPTVGLFTSFGWTNLGFSYTASTRGDRDRELIYRDGNLNSGIVVTQSTGLDFPMSWRMGISQRVGARIVLGADLEYEGWSESDLPLNDPVTADDQWRWCLGAEFLPGRGENTPWYRSFPLRAGYSKTTLGYRLDGAAVSERVISVGCGSYFGRNNGLIDVALEFINREVDNPAYPVEDVLRLSVSLSLFEKWTRIPRRRGVGE
ncbi:MAG: hypothetical protein FVQ81_09330 [Candidatus Glassbacteria bacterium]|nr:hypothetical protein [Candidatus Glassbacteria bacterium]